MADTNKPPRALETHTNVLYERLEELGKPDPKLDDAMIVKTRLTYLFQELDIPAGYYSQIRSVLFDGFDPCVVMLERGSHGNPSVLAVRHPPDADSFARLALTLADRDGTVSVHKRVDEIEAWRESLTPADENRLNVVDALRNHETRLAELETQMAAILKGETNGKTAQDRNNRSTSTGE